MNHPFVTIAIPCLDEEERIEDCVRTAQAQDWPQDRIEILVADGMSHDATREILARLAGEDARLQLVDNPARRGAAALNECIRRARGDVIVRMDANADYPRDFVRRCVDALEQSGADSASGPVKPRTRTFFQRCVAAAVNSPLTVGGASGAGPHKADDAMGDSVRPGAFLRNVFERVGLFDPKAVTSEDAELEQRILGGGGRVYMSRDIVVHYDLDASMRELARQYFKYGHGSARTLVKHRRLASLRPMLPFLGLVGEAALLLTAPWHVGGLSLAAYVLATGGEAIRVGRSEGIAAIPVVWAIFPVLHVSQGAGFAAGLVRYSLRPDWTAPEHLPSIRPAPIDSIEGLS